MDASLLWLHLHDLLSFYVTLLESTFIKFHSSLISLLFEKLPYFITHLSKVIWGCVNPYETVNLLDLSTFF